MLRRNYKFRQQTRIFVHKSRRTGNLPADMKFLPVAILMAETNLPTRKDTIIVWLRPTESLNKLLPEGIRMEDYMRTKMKGKESR